MWRFCILLLIVAINSFAYEPLTREAAATYIDNNREQAITDIIRIDIIENTELIIPDPVYGALVLKNDDLVIFPTAIDDEGFSEVNLFDLKYRIKFKSYTITDFAKPLKNKFSFKSFMWGFGAGFLTGILIGIFAE